ncbi:SH3 domain-containing kinase-binding protein 1 [Loa loa]|uniref:SH3 domain-containing kinase-binding protein 1 n=1 Tax=Loa loa TaxID=7209 RepID=A0A1I7VAR1_LOALO|nr:SH3 domain-containing kinase-binding protein 1 [Loa loa]EJD74897.1 SH3 domain-containing kinase-binding protein 1 [Loa loa]
MELRSGNVAKLVNRLSRDLSQLNKTTAASSVDVSLRRSGTMATRSATVRYSYKAAHEDELDLEVDDVIDVLEEAETGWMKGKLRNTGRIGLFPTNFVHFLDKTTGNSDVLKSNDAKKNFPDGIVSGDLLPEMPASRLSLISDPSENRLNYHIPDATTLGKKANSRARVLFTYSPKHEDELALREVGQIVGIVSKSTEDPGWLLAEVDGRQGLIPDNFVEILRPSIPTSTINSETHKMPLPPNVPAKPVSKPVVLSSGAGRRTTTSSVFAQMHSSLADAFTKPPKQFTARAVKTEESSAGEGQPGDRLSHITATRPKQPNKRPPSTVFRTKSNEGSTNDDTSMVEYGRISPTTSSAASLSNSYLQQPLSIAPSIKSVKVQQALSPKNNSNDISDEFVPRSEYNRLVQQFEELLTTMNKFRLEMSQKVSMLEAKITKQ